MSTKRLPQTVYSNVIKSPKSETTEVSLKSNRLTSCGKLIQQTTILQEKKKNKPLINAVIWINCKHIMLNEKDQTEKRIHTV